MTHLTDILTFSGGYFNFADLRANKIEIEDVAHALSNVCRFAGHCPRFYSVAQHSVLVYRITRDVLGVDDPVVLMQALLHDAPEAYMGDVTTPLKRFLLGYREMEDELQQHIMQWFSLPVDLDPLVKKADLMALAIEKREIWSNDDTWVVLKGVEEVQWSLICETPRLSEATFLNAYRALDRALKSIQ
jgi:hypothetical protein